MEKDSLISKIKHTHQADVEKVQIKHPHPHDKLIRRGYGVVDMYRCNTLLLQWLLSS